MNEEMLVGEGRGKLIGEESWQICLLKGASLQ